MKRATALTFALLFAATAALAADGLTRDESLDASGAFELMKSLGGTWIGEAVVVSVGQKKEDGVKSPSKVVYRTIANETSVIGTYQEGKPMEMVSIYHQDGPDELIHTHYCAVGNQPTMSFKKTDEPGVVQFMFLKGANMDVEKDGHVHNSKIKFIDENTIETETDLWNGGKKTSTRYTRMTRQLRFIK